MQEFKKQHLDMIENIITRMANNSFLIKGWSISLISAILIFADHKNDMNFIYMLFLPNLAFWFLDSFYLQLERKFKRLYEKVQNDYIRKTDNVALFDMNTKNIKVENIISIMFSKSELPIHFTIFLILLVIVLIAKIQIFSFICKGG
ncbi:MAG: hypothetical protein WCY19_02615 [Candidatus Gastranaerophilaceae bacterium]